MITIYESQTFKLQMSLYKKQTRLTLHTLAPIINTKDLPATYNFLFRHCPTVLTTTCFNDQMLSFKEEVKATEIGHLFEHIILEEIYQRRTCLGHQNIVVNGTTSWNWVQERMGIFHIVIDTAGCETEIITGAISRALVLLEQLLLEHKIYGQASVLPVENVAAVMS